MDNKTKIQGATYSDDLSGLKLDMTKQYTLQDIYKLEAKNISKVALKYLLDKPSKKIAPFNYEWMLKLHYEMFGDVWEWAGQLRQVELSIGIKAYKVSVALKELVDDLSFWQEHKTYDSIEIAARLHHRAVSIHPFKNANGRWSRMMANIFLMQNNLSPTKWNEDQLSKENVYRDDYIDALKKADNGDFQKLIKLQSNIIK